MRFHAAQFLSISFRAQQTHRKKKLKCSNESPLVMKNDEKKLSSLNESQTENTYKMRSNKKNMEIYH